MVFNEVELEPRITVHGIEIDGEFKQAVLEALSMRDLHYIIEIHRSRYIEANTWCREHLGSRWDVIDNRSGQWTCFWVGNEDHDRFRFYFARERDMIWFALQFAS
jgi:hypothetical protein